MKNLIAECFGTFCLVFIGAGAIVVNDTTNGTVTHVGVALTFGLVVLAMIYAVGDSSGAHINPAVTLGFFAAGRFAGRRVLPYIGSQLIGAATAGFLLHALFPAHATLGGTQPAGAVWQSLALETILTAILMFVILRVSTGAQERGLVAGIVVGAVIAMESLFAGPICGASMNPARSLAPALATRQFSHLWIYLAGPCAGSLAGVLLCRIMRDENCCSRPKT